MTGDIERLLAVEGPVSSAGGDSVIRVIGLGLAGRRDEARRSLAEHRAGRGAPGLPDVGDNLMAWLDRRPTDMVARACRRSATLKIMDDPEAIFQIGWLLCDVGELERGLDHLRRAVAKGYFVAPTLATGPAFDGLRSDPGVPGAAGRGRSGPRAGAPRLPRGRRRAAARSLRTRAPRGTRPPRPFVRSVAAAGLQARSVAPRCAGRGRPGGLRRTDAGGDPRGGSPNGASRLGTWRRRSDAASGQPPGRRDELQQRTGPREVFGKVDRACASCTWSVSGLVRNPATQERGR